MVAVESSTPGAANLKPETGAKGPRRLERADLGDPLKKGGPRERVRL